MRGRGLGGLGHAGRALLAMTLGAPALLACSGPPPAAAPDYVHNRRDYEAFRARQPGLLEPNYLPFMATRVELPGESPAERASGWLRRWIGRWPGLGSRAAAAAGQEAWVFCRWDDAAFPIPVFVSPPEIPERLRDDLDPRPPEHYVAAVERALARWERDLEGRDLFRRVASPDAAVLNIDVRGEPAPLPNPSLQVLGSTRLGGACQVEGGAVHEGVLRVRYQVSELKVFVADQHGLLLPDQVERVALHEIGHALGMRGHSPIPADLMYRVVRDRLPRGELGAEDVNSFLSLYALPNGSVYTSVGELGDNAPGVAPGMAPARAAPSPGPGPPRLELAPHVDPALGFEVQLPEGWTRLAMERGVVAVDGLTWEYDASFQLLVRPYPSIDAYLSRHAPAYLADAELLEQSEVHAAGVPGLRFVLARPETESIEELSFLESGDGRVLVVIAECAAAQYAAYRPWFAAILASLELTGRGSEGDRDYFPTRPGSPEP